jgi:hypothetical protein
LHLSYLYESWPQDLPHLEPLFKFSQVFRVVWDEVLFQCMFDAFSCEVTRTPLHMRTSSFPYFVSWLHIYNFYSVTKNCTVACFCLLFLAVLGQERALYFPGKCSTTWATFPDCKPATSAFYIDEITRMHTMHRLLFETRSY